LRQHEAQRLIVEGFFAPVIDRIPLANVREQLREVIQTKIGSDT
jgi:Fe-S cluster assembly protein SufD